MNINKSVLLSLILAVSIFNFRIETAHASYPGINGEIVFMSDRTGTYNIFKMDADGSNVTQLTRSVGGVVNRFPVWSPDGTKIAFESSRDNNYPQLYVMNSDGSNIVALTTGVGVTSTYPDWSPDGSKIAFMSTRTGSYNIFKMSANGTSVVQLTGSIDNVMNRFPVWSPDGTKIAFESTRSGSPQIYVMSADGGSALSLTAGTGGINEFPDWSPDGTQIVFMSNRSGLWEIYKMNSDGTNVTQLTSSGSGYNYAPVWSPDGTKIVFTSNRDNNYPQIYVMDSDGSNVKALTTGVMVTSGSPNWKRIIATPPNIITDSLPDATVDAPYYQTLETVDGKEPFSWSVPVGNLPPGIILSEGAISGTPTTAGDFNFSIQITDAYSQKTARDFTITVNPRPDIETYSLQDATLSGYYSQEINVSGGTGLITWGINEGVLPPGLSLATSTGVIFGTPTLPGSYSFIIQAEDIYGVTDSQSLTISVNQPPTIVGNLPDKKVNRYYSHSINVSGGAGPLTWSLISGILPNGLTLDSLRGTILGQPNLEGVYAFTVQVRDINNMSSVKTFSITINP